MQSTHHVNIDYHHFSYYKLIQHYLTVLSISAQDNDWWTLVDVSDMVQVDILYGQEISILITKLMIGRL